MSLDATYDYVIVGGGTAGCVFAETLSRDGDRSVLLIEAGDAPDTILFSIPLAFTLLLGRQKTGWGLMSEPEPGLGGRRLPIPRGKVLGGTSAINGMIYNHGQPGDYDGWAASGLTGWSYADLLPWLRKQEANWRGPTDSHGGSGPVRVSRHGFPSRLLDDVLAAARSAGFPVTDDFVAPVSEGVGLPDFNIAHGRRVSSAKAFLEPAQGRSNLTVLTRAMVQRVVLEKGRATGVEVETREGVRRFGAAEEVVLCAGALKSPHLLELSGIGGRTHLDAVGIETLHHLPGVGEGLNEQPACSFDFPVKTGQAFDRELRFDRMALSAVNWALRGTGAFTAPPMIMAGILKMLEGSEKPDVRIMASGVAIDARVWFPFVRKPRGHILMGAFSLCYPRSKGSVHARSDAARETPSIRYNLLSDADDRRDMRAAYRRTRDIYNQQPIARHLGPMQRPAVEPRTDDDIDAFFRQMGATTHHPVGSCCMGRDDKAVVDADCRVIGLSGLRVMDASIFPTQIAGNPTALIMAASEMVADRMLNAHAAKRVANISSRREPA